MTKKTEMIFIGILFISLIIMFPDQLIKMLKVKEYAFLMFTLVMVGIVLLWVKFNSKNY